MGFDILGHNPPVCNFAALPTQDVMPGTRAWVNDSTVAASGGFGTTITAGGGTYFVPVYFDGTQGTNGAWVIG
jgi:hypothetical protein